MGLQTTGMEGVRNGDESGGRNGSFKDSRGTPIVSLFGGFRAVHA